MKRTPYALVATMLSLMLTPLAWAAGPAASGDELRQYVSKLQAAPDDDALRQRIIKLALKAAPPVPAEAVRLAGGAEYAVKLAKGPDDFLDAVEQYEKALLIAPWVADYYYNLGLCQEKAGRFQDATRSLSLYLIAAPDAKDAEGVQKRIGGLEFAARRAARKGVEKKKRLALAGTWVSKVLLASGESSGLFANRYVLEMDGAGFRMRPTQYRDPYDGSWRSVSPTAPIPGFSGKVEGSSVSGTVDIDYSGERDGAVVETAPFSGEVDPTGAVMRLRYTLPKPCCGWTKAGLDKFRGGGWRPESYAAEFTKE